MVFCTECQLLIDIMKCTVLEHREAGAGMHEEAIGGGREGIQFWASIARLALLDFAAAREALRVHHAQWHSREQPISVDLRGERLAFRGASTRCGGEDAGGLQAHAVAQLPAGPYGRREREPPAQG
jgi:hypothetical protein